MSGLLTAVAARPSLPKEQIRFATILNGGVSLAVWMGGVSVEIDRLVRGQGAYQQLLAFVGSTARVDVITGTSAGGINGAALALAQANPAADLRNLRELWGEHGDIRRLLRQPFGGQPTSVLKGDEYFLPRLQDMMAVLALDPPTGTEPPPIDLSITTTVLRGNQSVGVDSMGTLLPQQIHGGRFHWTSVDPGAGNPFAKARLAQTAAELALACRATASFPFAFEPVFIPAHRMEKPPDDRPDMSRVVKDWGDIADRPDRSRYAVDGGVMTNTPTRAALKAVERMQAGTESIRRVMLLVYPHAPAPGMDKADLMDDPPTVLETMTRMMNASRSESQRTFVEELERHNEQAAGRRGTREDVINNVKGNPAKLDDLFKAVYSHYRHLRIWRAGRDLARRATDAAARSESSALRRYRWTYERVRMAAGGAQEDWDKDKNTPDLPYVPRDTPRAASVSERWRYGTTAALGVTDTVSDILVRLLRLMSTDVDARRVGEAWAEVSRRRIELLRCRDLVDAPWQSEDGDPVRSRVHGLVLPDVAYWTLRIASYARVMTDGDPQRVENQILAVAAKAENALQSQLETDLKALLLEDERLTPQIGLAVTEAIKAVVEQVDKVLPTLAKASDELLMNWFKLLGPGTGDPNALLFTLIQVEVATTALGDEVTSGATLPLDVVQLSAATTNAFTEVTRSADDKLGGMSLQRFGGFLKRSWRMNDWIWGRVDAATILCLTVLKPSRIRRTAELSGYLNPGLTPEDRATNTVHELLTALFGSAQPTEARIATRRISAIKELIPVFDPGIPVADLPASLPKLADLFAFALHAQIVPEELPALAGAVKVDLQLGGNAQANGAVFVKQYADLIARAQAASTQPLDLEVKAKILAAFDRAGIGREMLADEARSDAMIRTATNAAAVGITLLDSDRLGLTPIKPATRAIRGAALIPYWILSGLASQKGLLRNLAFLALALGGALLVLAIFGALPEALLVPAATIGGGAVVVALAFGAMRSGTMLHGVVLLPSGIVLTAIGIKRQDHEIIHHQLWPFLRCSRRTGTDATARARARLHHPPADRCRAASGQAGGQQ